jgi:hypothetical protein
MPRVLHDGVPVKRNYEPPPLPMPPASPEAIPPEFAMTIVQGFREAIARLPAPVVNVPKPEVKINAPVYVTTPEVKVPSTTVNVPEGKAPVVNIEPAAVTLQTNRPSKWTFKFNRNELGQITTVDAEAKS